MPETTLHAPAPSLNPEESRALYARLADALATRPTRKTKKPSANTPQG